MTSRISKQAMVDKLVAKYPGEYSHDALMACSRQQILARFGGKAGGKADFVSGDSKQAMVDKLVAKYPGDYSHDALMACSRQQILARFGGKADFVSVQIKQAMITRLLIQRPELDPEELWQRSRHSLVGAHDFKDEDSKQHTINLLVAANPTLDPAVLQGQSRYATALSGFVRTPRLQLFLVRVTCPTTAAPLSICTRVRSFDAEPTSTRHLCFPCPALGFQVDDQKMAASAAGIIKLFPRGETGVTLTIQAVYDQAGRTPRGHGAFKAALQRLVISANAAKIDPDAVIQLQLKAKASDSDSDKYNFSYTGFGYVTRRDAVMLNAKWRTAIGPRVEMKHTHTGAQLKAIGQGLKRDHPACSRSPPQRVRKNKKSK